ncbi:hypothetical protein GEMRC1_006475 [Eukaryota sp. GEM-RC1]
MSVMTGCFTKALPNTTITISVAFWLLLNTSSASIIPKLLLLSISLLLAVFSKHYWQFNVLETLICTDWSILLYLFLTFFVNHRAIRINLAYSLLALMNAVVFSHYLPPPLRDSKYWSYSSFVMLMLFSL